jgi:hypothetical protein
VKMLEKWELFMAMLAALARGCWERMPGHPFTVRWSSTVQYDGVLDWNGPYCSMIFISLTDRGPKLGIIRAPWVSQQDHLITYDQAIKILENPGSVLELAEHPP